MVPQGPPHFTTPSDNADAVISFHILGLKCADGLELQERVVPDESDLISYSG